MLLFRQDFSQASCRLLELYNLGSGTACYLSDGGVDCVQG